MNTQIKTHSLVLSAVLTAFSVASCSQQGGQPVKVECPQGSDCTRTAVPLNPTGGSQPGETPLPNTPNASDTTNANSVSPSLAPSPGATPPSTNTPPPTGGNPFSVPPAPPAPAPAPPAPPAPAPASPPSNPTNPTPPGGGTTTVSYTVADPPSFNEQAPSKLADGAPEVALRLLYTKEGELIVNTAFSHIESVSELSYEYLAAAVNATSEPESTGNLKLSNPTVPVVLKFRFNRQDCVINNVQVGFKQTLHVPDCKQEVSQ